VSRKRAIGPLFIVVAFAISRLLFAPIGLGIGAISLRGNLLERAASNLSGKSFNAGTLHGGMPLLDHDLLRHDLGRSLWYLHSQPPLFNALVAGVLRLPGDFARNYQWLSWALALTFYLMVYALLRRMGIRALIATIAVILFMINPNALWQENAVYYGLPLAVVLVSAALLWERALRTKSAASLAAASLAVVILPLTRAFFTPMWCALTLLLMAFLFHRVTGVTRWKAVAATMLPFMLIVAFQIKQYVLFRQVLGSSWFGCNLAAMTAMMGADKEAALAAGKVSPLVRVYRNAEPEKFLPYFHIRPTGVPALDSLKKSSGYPNFHHIVYIPVGRVFLRDTLYLISRHPLKYALNVVNSAYIFCGYQIGMYFDHPGRFLERYSWREILAPLLGFPLLVISLVTAVRHWRSSQGAERAMTTFLLFTLAYVIAVSWLFEKAEGPVYRFQIDAFLWVFLAMAVQSRLPAGERSLGSAFTLRRRVATSAADVRN
jgi:hypothetical protein